jgi:hypothetical protein
MRPKIAVVAAAAVVVVGGCGVGQASVTRPATLPPSAASPSPDPSLTWLESPGGQEQVTFNDDVAMLANDLERESRSPTVANHLAFEADARVVRAEAEKIRSLPALLPTVNRAAYEKMLADFIIVANLLQPGPGYGTAAQDQAAWDTALAATNITVS